MAKTNDVQAERSLTDLYLSVPVVKSPSTFWEENKGLQQIPIDEICLDGLIQFDVFDTSTD